MRWEDVGEEFDGDGRRCVATPTLEAFASPMAPMEIGQVAGLEANPVTNAKALLRYGLPINKPICAVQKKLENISDHLRWFRVNFRGVESNVNGSLKIVQKDGAKIICLSRAEQEGGRLKTKARRLAKGQARAAVQEALSLVGRIEEDMVDGFLFVPKQYADRPLPQGPGDGGQKDKQEVPLTSLDGKRRGSVSICRTHRARGHGRNGFRVVVSQKDKQDAAAARGALVRIGQMALFRQYADRPLPQGRWTCW